MPYLTVEGGHPLHGELTIQGSKNAVLPILAGTLLSRGSCTIENCPRLRDVDASVRILHHLGCTVLREGNTLTVDTAVLTRCDIPDELMREMRSSVIFLGAILARTGEAHMSYPGGCELGPRPIDLHLTALRALGAEITAQSTLHCRASHLKGTEITLSLPSVGATENALIAACGAEGTSVIINAAREPEIADLQNFLRKCGADVTGAGSSVITVRGGRALHGCRYRVMGDRIVAATYLSAVASAGGEAYLSDVDTRTLSTVALSLRESGCELRTTADAVSIRAAPRLTAVRPVRTAPYPGFPTDAQSVLMAALLRAEGSSVFSENIFENRYRHVDELMRLGADIRVMGRVAVVTGVERLHSAEMRATDLRGGAAMVVAALAAEGSSRITAAEHIERGYESIERDLTALGARITGT